VQKRQSFKTIRPVKLRPKTRILLLLAACLLLCGFTWAVEFTASVIFPVEDAVSFDMVKDFPALVDPDDLRLYLTEPQMAGQITQGVRANLSANVYSGIELPDMTQESIGKKVIRVILDRIFS